MDISIACVFFQRPLRTASTPNRNSLIHMCDMCTLLTRSIRINTWSHMSHVCTTNCLQLTHLCQECYTHSMSHDHDIESQNYWKLLRFWCLESELCPNVLLRVLMFHLINPRRACAARVTVVVLCVCTYVYMYVCMCVCPLIPAASHIGITKERYQRILRNTGIV